MTWFSSRRLGGKKSYFYRQVFERFLVDRLCWCNFFIVFLHVLRLKVCWKPCFRFAILRCASLSRFPVHSLDMQVLIKSSLAVEEVFRSVGLKQHMGWSLLLLSSRSLVTSCWLYVVVFVQSAWCHKQVLFGTISNLFCSFYGNKTEISVEMLIVVGNKIICFAFMLWKVKTNTKCCIAQ